MRLQSKIGLGIAGIGAALWATRAYLRSQRRITLDGRVVVITGASRGLGLLVAREAARGGARLVIAARDASSLDDAAAELRLEGSPEVVAIPTDVSDRVQAQALIGRAIDYFGSIDILINNAGTMVVGPVESMTIEDFERVMATNYWGEVYTTLAVLPHMQARKFGRIGNVVSLGGKVAIPHMLSYTASKFALTGFNEGLRAELVKDGIYVTGIYPGTIRTGGHTHTEVKGDHEAEYTWFGLSDTLPGLSTSAHACARSLWRAVLDGEPEVVVGLPSKLAVAFHNLFPEWNAELQPIINSALPSMPTGPNDSVRGENIHGKVPDLVNRLIPGGTRPIWRSPTASG
jgi:short-subunit dehydrogenase